MCGNSSQNTAERASLGYTVSCCWRWTLLPLEQGDLKALVNAGCISTLCAVLKNASVLCSHKSCSHSVKQSLLSGHITKRPSLQEGQETAVCNVWKTGFSSWRKRRGRLSCKKWWSWSSYCWTLSTVLYLCTSVCAVDASVLMSCMCWLLWAFKSLWPGLFLSSFSMLPSTVFLKKTLPGHNLAVSTIN